MKRFYLLGESISYSLSPRLHQRIFELAGLEGARYEIMDISLGTLGEAMDGLRSGRVQGYNVTAPHKRAALALADGATDEAREIGACNLLTLQNGRALADNADAAGFARLLTRARFDPKGKTCALLGAGGAARAVRSALCKLGAGEVILYSRSPDGVETRGYDAFTRASLIVNCAPHGADMRFCYPFLEGCELAVDLSYEPRETDFLSAARARGVRGENGLVMLVWQAILSEEAFWGVGLNREALELALLKEC